MKKYLLTLSAVLLLIMLILPGIYAKPPAGDITAVRLYGDAWGDVASATTPPEDALTSIDTNEGDTPLPLDMEDDEPNSGENNPDLMTSLKITLVKLNLLIR